MADTRKARVPMSEQIKLINECRQSGMTDADWCHENGIAASTFYNWVSRCRRAAAVQIPAVNYGHLESPRPKQDVVPIDIIPDHRCRICTLTIHIRSKLNGRMLQSASAMMQIQPCSQGFFTYCRSFHVRRYLRAGKDIHCLRLYRYAEIH